jgi:hypothetical protein
MADMLSIVDATVDATDSREGEFSVLGAILPLQF